MLLLLQLWLTHGTRDITGSHIRGFVFIKLIIIIIIIKKRRSHCECNG